MYYSIGFNKTLFSGHLVHSVQWVHLWSVTFSGLAPLQLFHCQTMEWLETSVIEKYQCD